MVGTELVILAGEDGIHQDTHQSGHGQTGEADGDGAQRDLNGTGVADTHSQTHDHGGNQDIAALREVYLVFYHVPDTHSGDHAVEHQADTAHGGGRHGDNESGELGAEGQDNGEHGSHTDHLGIINLAQGQHAGVFTVGGVGGSAEEGGQGGGQTVAYQSPVEAGILNKVLADGGRNGADVAYMLHHGSQRDGHDGHDGGHQQTMVQVGTEDREGGLMPHNGKTYPVCLAHQGNQVLPGGRIHNHGEDIGADHTQQDGNDLHHALAPDIAGHHDQDGNQSHPPVVGAVGDGGAGEGQTDADDDRSGDNGGEVAHDLLGTELLKEEGQDQVHKAGAGNTEAGIGKQSIAAIAAHGPDGIVAADKSEGGAQERGDLPAGDQMEQQSAETRKQQSVGHVQPGQGRHQHGGAEHGEEVLHTQQEPLGGCQGGGVVHDVGIGFRSRHKIPSFLFSVGP